MRGFFAACLMVSMILLAGSVSYAQLQTPNMVRFNRNDKVLKWETVNRGDYMLNDKMGFDFMSSLSTSLSMTSGSGVKDRWLDTVSNKANILYNLSNRIDLTFSASEEWNRDTMSTLGNSLLTTDVDGGIRYRLLKNLVLNGGIGHIYDRRFENEDSGGILRGGLRFDAEPVDDVSLDISATGEKTDMERSKDIYSGKGTLSYNRKDVGISLSFEENYNDRGYFSDIDRSTIEKRKREEQTLVLGVSKGDFSSLNEGTAYEVSMNLGRKLIDDSANDDESSSKYQNNADGDEKGVSFRVGKAIAQRITTQWGMEYGNVFNGVERLSRRRTQTDIGTRGSVFFGIGRADSIEVGGMIKRTRIDTPVGVTNDRDELKIESGVLYTHDFSDIFETALDFRVLETHYVNIDVSQSSNNKWMKTYSFSPSLIFTPGRSLRFRHTVNVYANYITYDYDADYSPRSNISRKLTSESWVDYEISDRTLLTMGAMFEENDYGMLNSAGDKLPAEEGIKRFGDVSVEYRFADWLVFIPQYIYAIRRDWSVSGDTTSTIRREVDQTYGLGCRMFSGENGSIDVSFKRIVRTTIKYPVRIRDYISMRLSYGF